jgi:hypothetical protein
MRLFEKAWLPRQTSAHQGPLIAPAEEEGKVIITKIQGNKQQYA